jgi:predicted DNA-binding protein with PD1-like motif
MAMGTNWRGLMRSHELQLGRTFGVTFDHGEDFFAALNDFCSANNVRQGIIPSFIAGFAEARIVGTCGKIENPQAPLWESVYLTNAEVLGSGTVAFDPDEDKISPHIHVALGLKERSAVGHTSHLLEARVLFLTEMTFVEVVAPEMQRRRNPDIYDVPLLTFGISQLAALTAIRPSD